MVGGEGECMGKGGSFKGRGRKYEREKGKEMRSLCEREGESVRERGREYGRESVWMESENGGRRKREYGRRGSFEWRGRKYEMEMKIGDREGDRERERMWEEQ